MKRMCSVVLLALGVFGAATAYGQEVLRGLDFWETRPHQTFVDLAPLEPLCNFQFPGANSTIPLRGIPLETSLFCPGQNLGSTNTIIRRTQDTNGLNSGQATVPIEIVGLHLMSVQPFTVIYQGSAEAWNVDVTLAPVQDLGSMTIRKTGGGTSTTVNLSASQEVPPNGSTATGIGNFTINTTTNTLTFDITHNVVNETAAHIHGPAPVGMNAAVLFGLPAGPHKVGSWIYPEIREADILAGRTYVNIHSNAFPAGEIRAQIVFPSSGSGGTFDSSLPVRPHFTFTRVDPCPAVVRCEIDGPVITLQTSGAPWSYTPNPQSPGLVVPSCTSNFFPGVVGFSPQLESGGTPNPGACHSAGSGHQHCVTPPQKPALFENDWQMAVHFTFFLENISQKSPINDFHFRRPRYIVMNPVGAYNDSSIYIKSVSICDTAKVCSKAPPDRWARVNWDSLDANFRKEAWWVFPPVPPKGFAPEMDVVFSLPCNAAPGLGAWFEIDWQTTSGCAVVDSGTFRFSCPPAVPCPIPPGCTQSPINLIGVPKDRGSSLELLRQNVPNPSVAATTIRFRVEKPSDVTLRIFDAQGRMVRTLVRGAKTVGEHAVQWNGNDDAGNPVRAGTYFYQIDVGGIRQSRKMVILK